MPLAWYEMIAYIQFQLSSLQKVFKKREKNIGIVLGSVSDL